MEYKDLALLLEINKILNSILDLDKLLTIIVEQAAVVVKAEAGSLMLLDHVTNELIFDIALGEKGEQVKQIRLKVGEGIAGWVAQEGKSLIVNEVEKDTRWSSRADTKSNFQTRSMLCVPLIFKGKISGVMEAINKKDNGAFSAEDQQILEALAAQAAVAIENARLFKEVKEKKDQIETVFRGMNDGVIVTDAEYLVRIINAAGQQLLNVKEKDIPAGNILDWLEKDYDFSFPREQLRDISVDFELKRKVGKHYFLQNMITRLRDEQHNTIGYIMLLHDISEAKKEGLLKHNFISLISHKLKTPLTGILGYSSLLLGNEGEMHPDRDLQQTALQDIVRQGQLLNNLVTELINFSLVEGEVLELNQKAVSITSLLIAVAGYFKEKAAGQAEHLQIEAAGLEKRTVWADEPRVKEVFSQLVDNALKFNKNTEKIVRIAIRELPSEKMEFSVSDNGPGIPPEEQGKIFQKFYQVEDSFTGQVSGAGLGLSLVKRIVEGHGGGIKVESKIGAGSSFIFTLPSR